MITDSDTVYSTAWISSAWRHNVTTPGRYTAQDMLKNLDQFLTVPARSAGRSRWLTIALAATLLAACGGDREQRTQFQTAQEFYDRAQSAMNSGNYRQAIQIFEQLESRYPFSAVGKQSQIDLIYCYYKNGSQPQALDAADQFMRENPTHPRVDYALYVKGLALFDRPPGALDGVLRIDRNDRPPDNARQAFSVFRQLVERYPASDYADDAVQRMRYIKDKLARYENLVADYYLRMGAWVAALNRAKGSLEAYDGTEANKRSLEIMIEAYDQLGLTDLAENSRQVLAENFPST
ncbi:MAG: outer membrane protein assembly factor BamD [Pseudomonadota bacterium]